jgi:cellulose synthase/poly-beta-1,6-N-acetylglucosamine synthase-like glycosyltransferase
MIVLYLLVWAAFIAYHVRAFRATQHEPRNWDAVSLPEGERPKLSVLVPAWNAREDIPAFVNAFQSVDYPDKELILCVGGSDEGLQTAQHFSVAEGAPVQVLEQLAGEGKQGGLRKCFAASSGQIIYLTDIDCRMDSESLQRVLEPILAAQEQVVTGSSKPTSEQQTIAAVRVHWSLVRKAERLEPRYIKGILGRNCAVSREALDKIGGFDFDAPTGTDYRLAQELFRAGYKILLVPASEIETEYAWPLRSYIRKRGRWVRNVLLFAERPKQNAEYYNALSVALLPMVMALALLLSLLSSPILPPNIAWFPAFMVLLLFLHGALNRLRYAYETLGSEQLSLATLKGAFVNWSGQLAAGVYAFWTWVNPDLRKRW